MKSNAICRVIVAASLSLLPLAGAAGQSGKPNLNAPPPSEKRQGMSDLPDSTAVERWAELFANLVGEFKNDGRDPKGIIRGDFSTREISILTDPESEESWVGITVNNRVLLNGDLRAVAATLYRTWKAAVDTI